MKKTPKCKSCGQVGHYQTFCQKTPRKPIKKVSIKPKTTKTITKSKAKERAWRAFSDYIRTRDALKTTGTLTHSTCVTCVIRGNYEWKEYSRIQAGHGVGGRGNAVLFHEDIVNGQCSYCNSKPPMGLGGDYGNYQTYFVETYGLERAKQFQALRHDTSVKYSTKDYLLKEQEYKEKLANLLKST